MKINKSLVLLTILTTFIGSPALANCKRFINNGSVISGQANSYQGHKFFQEVTITKTYDCNNGTCFRGFITFTGRNITDRDTGYYYDDEIKVIRNCTACTIPGDQVYEGYCTNNNIRGEYLDSGGNKLMGRFIWE
jgi:hypothetical protein